MKRKSPNCRHHIRCLQAGLTLVELMVAMAISLVVLLALVTLFVNTSRSNTEMAKTNDLIEDGRISIQLLADDLVHAGYWGGYLPEFDDLTSTTVPGDAPTAIPNPCQPYANWDSAYRANLLGIPVQADDTLPTGAGCLSPLTQRANTDVLVVRHVETCVPGIGNCDADAAGKLYFQSPLCEAEKNALAQGGTVNSITLSAAASTIDDVYVGATLHTLTGTGAGQYRVITDYNGGTNVATVNTAWTTTPDNSTTYALEYMLGTNAYPFHQKNCTTVAEKRRFISNLYYVADVTRNGQAIPALVRSQLDSSGGTIEHQAPVALIDGIEAFRVALGIDNISKSPAPVNYSEAIFWHDPNNKDLPTNRGDGAPDTFIHCTTAVPCTAGQLSNVVAVKLYVLTRSREITPGYTDTKTYCLGEPDTDGSCPAENTIAAANDHYKRHVFITSIRLTNVAGRRETP